MALDVRTVTSHVDRAWDDHVVATLEEFIRIPNVSMAYDPDWATAGHMTDAVELIRRWCEQRIADGLDDASVEVLQLPELSPLLVIDVPATPGAAAAGDDDTVILYGHLDKQPPFDGWRDGLGPWDPVIEGERLYGRGAADDGYAVFSALTALAAVRAAGGEHARCVVLIEASEESGSPDLPAYLQEHGDRLGDPSLVVALDSSCADWDHLWITTSLRGLVDLTLRVDVLTEGIHSGSAGGAVPSTFRILRLLLDRIEDPADGRLVAPELHVEVPEIRRRQIGEMAEAVGLGDVYPFLDGVGPDPEASDADLILARTWGSSLEITGFEGAPPPGNAGNVLRPTTSLKLSVRVPPTADPQEAAAALVQELTTNPPYGARVTVTPGGAEPGWHAPPEVPWLAEALDTASQATFGGPARSLGEGGTIPFMGMLGRQFPDAQFVITGVAGPGTNAHGPNEFLHLPTARRVTAAVAHVLDAHAHRPA